MFNLIAVSVFFFFWIWVRRRQRAQAEETDRLHLELLQTQSDLQFSQHRSQQLISLISALHERKVSPLGDVSWKELSDFAVQTIGPLIGAESVVLLRWDAQAGIYRGTSARGVSPQGLSDLKVHVGEGIIGRAVQLGKPVIENGPASVTGLPQEAFLKPPYIILPLWIHSQVHGLLIFTQMKTVDTETGRLAGLAAKQVELTMENLDLHEQRERVYSELVTTLSRASGAKETGSVNHAEHCRDLVRGMARELHLPQMVTEQIEFGAMLHDVGKLGISEHILSKPGPLSDEEYAVIKKHPIIGAQILQDVDFLRAVAPIVHYHHEWVNGQGYPEGLAGEEIPLGARMVSIVDAWDAMTTEQPYRPAMSSSNAVAELRQHAGTQFDPKLVDVFVHVVDQLEPHG